MSKVLSWIKGYPQLVVDGDGVFCKACSKTVSLIIAFTAFNFS